jgi:beta-glucosidase
VDAPGATPRFKGFPGVWFPSSPLKALQAKVPTAHVTFASGKDIAEAVAQAKSAEVAIVFAWQWASEGRDSPDLALPDGQDKLIAAVAAANPRTIVVLQTGGPVTMPWLQQTGAVLESWYSGSKGADAIANLLFGDVNPSGKLPLTFPVSEADLPHALVPMPVAEKPGVLIRTFDCPEGVKVGYKWYESEHKPVLFPFGFGLSYTSFRYSDLAVAADGTSARLTVKNTGARKGAEIAELYAQLPDSAGEPKRLVAWQKVELEAGESRTLDLPIDPLYLSIWDERSNKFVRPSGAYRMMGGGSSVDLPLTAKVNLE